MKRLFAFFAGFIITFLAITAVLVFYFYIAAPDRYNILVIGSDQRGDERARSDVLFVISMPKDPNQKPYFLSIPRDTKIEDSQYGLQKITHFYAYGDRPDDGKVLGNVDLTKKTVENLLDIKVDATVEVTFNSFQEIVDTMGGATVKGGQPVDGAEALAVVRDRFTEGRSDFSRQADEREVMRSLMLKGKSTSNIKKMMQFFQENDEARLHYTKVKAARFAVGMLIAHHGSIDIGEAEQDSLPGEGASIYTPDFGTELYYWVVDEAGMKKMVDEHLK